MRSRLVRLLSRVCIGLVCVVLLTGLLWGFYIGTRYWRVERAIGRFEAEPSQASADVLAELIDEHVPTVNQGERILELLLEPRVTKRKAYPRGSVPVIALELPFAVPFQNVSIAMEEQFLCDGASARHGQGSGGDLIRGQARFRALYPAPQKTGTYHVEIQQRYTFNLHHREHTWTWRPFGGPFPRCLLPVRHATTMRFRSLEQWDYACSLALQVEIVVVEKSRAERIELESNPDLDEAMRAAISSTTTPFMRSWYSTALGRRTSTGGLQITYDNLPAAVGFKPELRLSDGREIPADRRVSHRLYARAGSSGRFNVAASALGIQKRGSYTGSIILRSDPNAAYRDPAIKAIWAGTLEFPISFEVFSDEPNEP